MDAPVRWFGSRRHRKAPRSRESSAGRSGRGARRAAPDLPVRGPPSVLTLQSRPARRVCRSLCDRGAVANDIIGGAVMIKPYTAVGLIPTVRGIRKRKDIKLNLEHLHHLVKAASWLSSLDLPVRLIAFPEGALQAFNDEVLDLDHVQFARECAIDIPGEETDELGKIAKEYNAFIMAQAKARHPDLKDRFFNVGFVINPRGKVILQHYKVSPLFPVEHSVCPHDVYDWWVEK